MANKTEVKAAPLTATELLKNDAPKDAIEKRLNNENEISKELLACVKIIACTCEREYPYSGVGRKMCRRCRVLVLWETLNLGTSETQKLFDTKIP